MIYDQFSPFWAPCMTQYIKLKIFSKLRFKSEFDLTLSEVVSN
jgi:hypothetical protein